MDETTLKIAMAGFFHDIGKLADRELLNITEQYFDNHSGLYLPLWNGRYSHHHAVYTAAFIEHMKNYLPKEFNSPGWGEGDSFINLAAGHHNPDTPMQWIIAISDRTSSGWDRAEFDEKYNKAVTPKDYKRNRLVPILEHLSAEPGSPVVTSEGYYYCYPLKEITPKNIFPKLKSEVYPKDNEIASRDYHLLFDGFVEGLKGLFHREENKVLWFEHFESLAMIYASAVPAARAGHVIPDVSLYDHLKTTSAIASALYLFHKQTGSMAIADIKDEKTEKFLVISGDFYGIQNFIFSSGEAQKNRSKMLRGRSFAVSLFSELASDMLCRKIGIPSVSVILNAAGKFTLIAPNTKEAKQAVSETEKKINEWLIKVSLGEAAMGISYVVAGARDFVKGRFNDVWDNLHKQMEKKKYQKLDLDRFGGSVSDYLDSFYNDLNSPLCSFCGKRPSIPKAEGSHFVEDKKSSCALCRDHIFLGENLVKNTFLAITTREADIKGGDDNKLLEPIFGEYQAAFLDGALKEMAKSGSLLKHWDVSNNAEEKITGNVTARFINGYVPVYTKDDLEDERLLWGKKGEIKKLEQIDQISLHIPKSFGHIANKALNLKNGKYVGVEALGVLKADVDNLGLLIGCGLKGELFTLSRLATLSRQLNYYFSIYLPYLLLTEPEFRNVYTVFAGGDDLFLIGPWNRIIQLSEKIKNTFSEYVCKNPDIHLSAGISLHKPNTPVGSMAESSEADLEFAKEEGRNRVTVFNETVEWDEMSKLTSIQNELEIWIDRKWINTAMLYRLNKVMDMAGLEKRLLRNNRDEIHLEDMECTKWRAMLSYSVGRNAAKDLKAEERPDVVDHVGESLNKWLSEYGSKLKIPVWNILYNRRTMKN
ncbi:CRISPR subtype III-A/MTUBE-associated protein Cas10 [uncultured Desulfobacterium sp.]|uniref:CRISPR system single-strand-specific deoxyribonuclease Cas10/Csm1 (subtype III-A) n=1 Tax=uncultured Desulfobacterium sp. TaxID=201089 RepID=A0A445MU86_9BACT|nr:CRISPR subtype III-A/MTUBE-associated protein Cas10 [uncultured Desulfobacterium sp.]